ncbi:hypothetical protein EJB05_44631, partial [Eragrostis curvula]
MGKHLIKYAFMENYKRWTSHGEADRVRHEVVRPRIDGAFDEDAGVADMLNDYAEAHNFEEGHREEEPEPPEPTAKAYYDMLDSAQRPLHGHANVSQLDAIARNFDVMLTVIASMLPEGHILPKNMYESQKLLRALKMPYEKIHACPKGCVLFRKEHAEALYCPKCSSSRYLEVESGDWRTMVGGVGKAVTRSLSFFYRDDAEGSKRKGARKGGGRDVAKVVYGQDYDPRSHDLDGEVVMRAGKGKKHGRYWLGDSVIDTASTPTLSQIRARTVSGGPSIRERLTTTQTLQAQLEEERARREQLEASLAQQVQEQMQAQVEAQVQAQVQAQTQEMFSYFQTQFAAIGHPLPTPPMWAPRPPISSPPMPGSVGSNAGAG